MVVLFTSRAIIVIFYLWKSIFSRVSILFCTTSLYRLNVISSIFKWSTCWEKLHVEPKGKSIFSLSCVYRMFCKFHEGYELIKNQNFIYRCNPSAVFLFFVHTSWISHSFFLIINTNKNKRNLNRKTKWICTRLFVVIFPKITFLINSWMLQQQWQVVHNR